MGLRLWGKGSVANQRILLSVTVNDMIDNFVSILTQEYILLDPNDVESVHSKTWGEMVAREESTVFTEYILHCSV